MIDMDAEMLQAHYAALKARRKEIALRDMQVAGKGSRALQVAAEERLARAEHLAQNRQHWQCAAALREQRKHGAFIAAGFLRAHGWDIHDAREILLG